MAHNVAHLHLTFALKISLLHPLNVDSKKRMWVAFQFPVRITGWISSCPKAGVNIV